MPRTPSAAALRWREYTACVKAEDEEQAAELERLFVLEGGQPVAQLIEEGPDLSGEDGNA